MDVTKWINYLWLNGIPKEISRPSERGCTAFLKDIGVLQVVTQGGVAVGKMSMNAQLDASV